MLDSPIIFLPSNDNGARTVLPVAVELRRLSTPTALWTMDSVKGERAGAVLGTLGDELGGEPFSPPRTRLGPLSKPAMSFKRTLSERLRRMQPAALVLTNDWGWPENIALSAAIAEEVPTVLLQDGMLDLTVAGPSRLQRALWRAWRRADFAAGPMQAVYGANGADWHLVQGRDFARRSRALGMPRHRIRIVGQPRYDALLRESSDSAPVGGLRVLVAMCASASYGFMSEKDYAEQLSELVKAILSVSGAEVLLKPHPRCAMESLQSALNPLVSERFAMAEPTAEMAPCLQWCSVVVTDISSAGLEGLLLGKPMIAMPAFFPKPVLLSYDRHRLSMVAQSVDEVPDLLSAVAHGSSAVRATLDRFQAVLPEVCAHPRSSAQRAALALRRIVLGGGAR